MTQREIVLQTLKAAGPAGVRSDTFIKDFMPRAAARIQELKDAGHEIRSEREGKYVRWVLVGSSAGGRYSQEPDGSSPPRIAPSSASSEVAASGAEGSRELTSAPSDKAPGVAPRSNLSMFDPWAA